MSKKLTRENQINFVLKYIKPLLQQNKVKDARLITALGLSGKHDIDLNDDDRIEIITWMYKNLGPTLYFKDSNTIFPYEFSYYADRTFIIPETIQTIQRYAFSKSNIRKIIIPKNVRAIDIGAFSESSINEVIFENFSNVKLNAGVFADSDLKIIYVEDNADKSVLNEFHIKIPWVHIISSSTGEFLIEAE